MFGLALWQNRNPGPALSGGGSQPAQRRGCSPTMRGRPAAWRMGRTTKQAAITAFAGAPPIVLVSTTVVEVGGGCARGGQRDGD